MQHDEAVGTHAAERYLLGEMSADERARYEEHYFSCPECASDLSAAASFVDNARVSIATAPAPAFRAPPGAPLAAPKSWWWHRFFSAPTAGWVPALTVASLVMLAVVGYQRFGVIDDLRQQLAARDRAQGVPTIALRSASRGSRARLVVAAEDPYAVLQADVLPETPVEHYTASLLTADGQEQFRTAIAAPELGLPVTILLPVRQLAPGDYTLVFHDGDQGGREIGRFTFKLEKH